MFNGEWMTEKIDNLEYNSIIKDHCYEKNQDFIHTFQVINFLKKKMLNKTLHMNIRKEKLNIF